MENKLFLIAGLGNPGDKYSGTKHNVGFDLIDNLSAGFSIDLSKKKFNAEFGRGKIDGNDVVLVKPMSYMNLSGEPTQKVLCFFDIKPQNVIVIHDDLDLETGRIKLKKGGGHGGHNGIRSLISHIGQDFIRVRIGIGRPNGKSEVSGFVLSKFSKQDREAINHSLSLSEDAVLSIINDGISMAMNRFNRT